MQPGAVVCPQCRSDLPEDLLDQEDLLPCPACSSWVQILTFPARFKSPAAGSRGEAILAEGEASCFHHPDKRAVASCERCGRFLCALCELRLGAELLCPSCLHAGQAKGTFAHLDQRRILYDHLAWLLVLAPLLIWPLTMVTAPAAVILGFYSLRKPGSVVRKTRWRSYGAILLGFLQAGVWIWMLMLLVIKLLE